MAMLRAEKTTQNKDDTKVLIVGVMLAIGLMLGPLYFPRIQESRMVRDFVGLTPFKDVQLTQSELLGSELVIQGTMVKVRCTFVGLTAYVQDASGIAYRVDVDTSVEDGLVKHHNRVPSPLVQAWGPWGLSIDARGIRNPVSFTVNAQHHCGPGDDQENVFVTGAWGEFIFADQT